MPQLLERSVIWFAAHWAGNFLGVLLVATILQPNIRLPETGTGDYWATAAAFAAVLAFLNTRVRPVLYLALLPLTCCVMAATLGLAHFLIGATMFWIAGQLIDPIHVESFGWALLGALIVAAVATLVSSALLRHERSRRRMARS